MGEPKPRVEAHADEHDLAEMSQESVQDMLERPAYFMVGVPESGQPEVIRAETLDEIRHEFLRRFFNKKYWVTLFEGWLWPLKPMERGFGFVSPTSRSLHDFQPPPKPLQQTIEQGIEHSTFVGGDSLIQPGKP